MNIPLEVYKYVLDAVGFELKTSDSEEETKSFLINSFETASLIFDMEPTDSTGNCRKIVN
jgi:hypothetical protein